MYYVARLDISKVLFDYLTYISSKKKCILPTTAVMSYSEMKDHGRSACHEWFRLWPEPDMAWIQGDRTVWLLLLASTKNRTTSKQKRLFLAKIHQIQNVTPQPRQVSRKTQGAFRVPPSDQTKWRSVPAYFPRGPFRNCGDRQGVPVCSRYDMNCFVQHAAAAHCFSDLFFFVGLIRRIN